MYESVLEYSDIMEVNLENFPIERKITDEDFIDTMSARVNFNIDIEKKSWGVKGLIPSINSIILFVTIQRYDPVEDDYTGEDLELGGSKFTVEIESDGGTGYPTSIEINGDKITVNFIREE